MKKIVIVIVLLVLIGVASYPTMLSLRSEYYESSSEDNQKIDDLENIDFEDIDKEFENNDKEINKDDSEEKNKKNKEDNDKKNEAQENETTNSDNTNPSIAGPTQNNSSNNQSSGNSSNNSSNSNNNTQQTPSTPEPTPNPEPTPSVPTYAKLVLMDSESDEITVNQSENSFTLSGSMEEKELINGLSSGSYLRLKIVAPKLYSVAELNNMSVTLLYSGKTYTQASNNVLEVVSDSAYAYFYLVQEFMYGQVISIVVDWGDGKPITYSFTFNVDVK